MSQLRIDTPYCGRALHSVLIRKISPSHQAERSASDEDRVADGTEHLGKVKLRADVLRLRLQCSLPGQEFRWLVAAALRHVGHSARTVLLRTAVDPVPHREARRSACTGWPLTGTPEPWASRTV
jgi:predicted RNA polymerase sigma factor